MYFTEIQYNDFLKKKCGGMTFNPIYYCMRSLLWAELCPHKMSCMLFSVNFTVHGVVVVHIYNPSI